MNQSDKKQNEEVAKEGERIQGEMQIASSFVTDANQKGLLAR